MKILEYKDKEDLLGVGIHTLDAEGKKLLAQLHWWSSWDQFRRLIRAYEESHFGEKETSDTGS